ncbi:MAG: nitrophenyl compound nitroreductase subunit ArsF family protein [Planctomycetaceae bacterium]|nr:nitrophenyl compound nitroreductase subunit ArsF family protein [Planctomycetaceae bacterium]
MRPLPIFLIVFLSLVTASQVMGQIKDEKEDNRPPYYLTDVALDKKLGIDEKTEAPKEYIWLVYFHRVPGCDTCQLMSKYIYETVAERFAEDVKEKKVVLRYRNFEETKNAGLVKMLGVKSPSLAIIHVKDGKLVKAKFAGKIWSLASEKEKFLKHVEDETKPYLTELKEAKK